MVKVLHARKGTPDRYRLGRFRDEIGFLQAHPDFPGILPLLDSHVSGHESERAWYVMPVATPIRRALGGDPEPRAVVAAISEVASTLEALAVEGVAHRDIKPDNLFLLDGHCVIGDFGLVTYPDKDPRTAHGRKLGPIDYMAPEMRQDADRADPSPADVWSLAKTLWVLLTGESLPLPGTHRAAEPAHALTGRITFTFAAELDRLLEEATQIMPGYRPAISALARELQACLADSPEILEQVGVAELSARAAVLTATSRQAVTAGLNRRALAIDTWTELAAIVETAGRELGQALTFQLRTDGTEYYASAMLGMAPFTPFASYGTSSLLIPPGAARPNVEVVVAGAMRLLRDDGIADIAAVLRVHRVYPGQGRHDPHDIWVRIYHGVPVASGRMADRARDRVNHLLRAIRIARAGQVSDRQLRFRIGIGYAYDERLSGWNLPADDAYELTLTEQAAAEVTGHFAVSVPMSERSDIEEKAAIAMGWMERAYLIGDNLVAMLYRFFALEAILGDKSEGLKAHGLAFREMMLSHVIDGGFRHPNATFYDYAQIRSVAVHGGQAPDVSRDVAVKFESAVRDALGNYLVLARQQGFRKRGKLIQFLDQHPDKPELLEWIRDNGGPDWENFLDGAE